ncbi:MAG: sigma-54 dependent transcriptional regulator [Pseudomonadota bacterium]
MSKTILLLEDDPVLGPSLKQRLELESFDVFHALTIREARAYLARAIPDFVLSDIKLPDGSGEDLMADLTSRAGSVPTIFMTAFGNLDQAVRLVRAGARDYIAKPFDADNLVERVQNLIGASETSRDDTFGLSSSTRSLREMLDRLSDLDLPILLTGETGSGKEVAARYVHDHGARADKPFEAVNCAQISTDLAESFFFGHERGAFTGATDKRLGVFELVGGGTLFLDEIGEMSHDLQLKLLRVLQERSFRRLGANADQPFEGRVVCATNRDLEDAVHAGEFREDLLFRINVVTLKVPPLRERKDEITPLINHFVTAAAAAMKRDIPEVEIGLYDVAKKHDWPGNVRELRNRVERAVALMTGETLRTEDMFPDSHVGKNAQTEITNKGEHMTLDQVRQRAERDHIESVLVDTNWQMQESAKILGISRSTLWERVQKLGLQRDR